MRTLQMLLASLFWPIVLAMYECVSVPLYCLVIFTVARNSNFRSPFWQIILVLGFADLVHYVLTLLFYRCPLCALFFPIFASLPPFRWIGVGMFFGFFTMFLQCILHVSIALNRFSSVYFPFRHKKFWKKRLPLWLCTCLTVSLGFTFNRLFTVGQFQRIVVNNVTVGYVPLPVKFDLFQSPLSLWTAALALACACACILLNVSTIVGIVVQRKFGKSSTLDTGPEWNLFLVALWTMCAQMLVTRFELLAYFSLNRGIEVIYDLFLETGWICDICDLGQPWILVVVSSDLRAKVRELIVKTLKSCGTWSPSASASQPANTQNQNNNQQNNPLFSIVNQRARVAASHWPE